MLEKLQKIEARYNELREMSMQNDIISDVKKSIEINKEIASLQEMYAIIQRYRKYDSELKEAEEVLQSESDPDLLEMAKEQLQNAKAELEKVNKELEVAFLPKDPNDDKNIYLEIRPAAGGDEAGLFGTELFKMYMNYAQKKGRKTEIVEEQFSDIGGVKFVMVKISGEKVYSIMKFESGVHRVQRIPSTESNGRVHTSTVTVAIMPEVDDVDIVIDPKDITIDTYAASSAGGQNANKNQTGVRIHHNPTGIIVNIGDTKSQLKNKEKAFQILKAKLYQLEEDKKEAEQKSIRGNQIGNGDRSEKIRTYNYPQDRITDHRIHCSWANIPAVLMGDMDDIFEKLILENQAKLMSSRD